MVPSRDTFKFSSCGPAFHSGYSNEQVDLPPHGRRDLLELCLYDAVAFY